MRKHSRKLSALLLVCTLVFSALSFTGCATGGEATQYTVKTKLLTALNGKDYDAYLKLAYPPLREDIEKERKEMNLSEEDYMKYLQDKWFPTENTDMIAEYSKSFSKSEAFTEAQINSIIDEFIYYDDYEEITKAELFSFLIKDKAFEDSVAEFYEMHLIIICANDNYYFVSYEITDTPYVETTTVADENDSEGDEDVSDASVE